MARKARSTVQPNAQPHVPPVLDWEVSETLTANGRHMEPGTEFSVRGEGGARFIFQRHVRRPNGLEWVDAVETWKGQSQAFRSFRPERIRTVHRIARTRANAEA